MSGEYLPRVMAVLGAETGRRSEPAEWLKIESDLGFALPDDYKALVDAYAPVKLNGHLVLNHPATPRWNLGEYIRDTSRAWSEVPWGEDVDGDPRIVLNLDELEFGTLRGLTPIASADSGQTVFLAADPKGLRPLLFIEDGDGEFFEYSMSFSEWLYRYLAGEDMAGPNSSYFYPGPVELESRPMSQGGEVVRWYGPDRGV
ncbi:SMI1/KNR4 family protein [Streptomyces sp. NPDC059443]|uniref:SMI1/KNR4 family protein n=1 Tax=unclassified Streptomyces TaxID=2593676 RepID=UPI0036D1DED8